MRFAISGGDQATLAAGDVREVNDGLAMRRFPVLSFRAVKAFEKAGFKVVRQGKHIVMTTARVSSPSHATIR